MARKASHFADYVVSAARLPLGTILVEFDSMLLEVTPNCMKELRQALNGIADNSTALPKTQRKSGQRNRLVGRQELPFVVAALATLALVFAAVLWLLVLLFF